MGLNAITGAIQMGNLHEMNACKVFALAKIGFTSGHLLSKMLTIRNEALIGHPIQVGRFCF